MTYSIVDEFGVVVAEFDTEEDRDRCERALLLIGSSGGKSRARSNPQTLDQSTLTNIRYIDEILPKLNAAIFGESEKKIKLTDRVLPFIRFFFATNTQPVGDEFFKMLSLFKGSDIRALIKYFRNVEQLNPEFKTLREHDRIQALYVLWTAAVFSGDLDNYLSARVGAQVFFTQQVEAVTDETRRNFISAEQVIAHRDLFIKAPLNQNITEGVTVSSDYFKVVCSKTQGFILSYSTLNLATKLMRLKREGADSSRQYQRFWDLIKYTLNDKIFVTERTKKVQLTTIFGDFKIDKEDLQHHNAIFNPCKYPQQSDEVSKNISGMVTSCSSLISRLNTGTTPLLSCGHSILSKSDSDFVDVLLELDSLDIDDDLLKQIQSMEDALIVRQALNLMYLCKILSSCSEALPALSAGNLPTLTRALDVCISAYTNVVRLSAKDIHDIYLCEYPACVGTDKTLFEFMWPLIREVFISDPRLCTEESGDAKVTLQYIRFLDDAVAIVGKALAEKDTLVLDLCGIYAFAGLPSPVDSRILPFYPELDEYVHKHFGERFSEGFVFEDFFIDDDTASLLRDYMVHDDIEDLHEEYMKGRLDLKCRKITSTRSGDVSVYFLPKKHFLNLFVGHEKISNCCMYPGSAGFSCNEDAFKTSPVTESGIGLDIKSSHIVLGYDHIEESFIGSAWVYNLNAMLGVTDDNGSYEILGHLNFDDNCFQIDQFELTNKYETDESLKGRVKEFLELCVAEYCSCSNKEAGFVMVNKSSYTASVVQNMLDELSENPEFVPFDLSEDIECVSFGPSDEEGDVYTDSAPDCDDLHTLSEKFKVFAKSENTMSALSNFRDVERQLERCRDEAYRCDACDRVMLSVYENNLRLDRGKICEDCYDSCHTCEECGRVFDEDDYFYDDHTDKVYCRWCVDTCTECEETKMTSEVEDGICNECAQHCTMCDSREVSLVDVGRESCCDSCAVKCETCNTHVLERDFNKEQDMCDECVRDMSEDDSDDESED